jgi:hypothetical protein
MPYMKKIDAQFINEWEPRYDQIASDQEEYLALKDVVRIEAQDRHTITRYTFKRIINWKSQRAKGKINWSDYRIYQKAFQQVLSINEDRKMEVLVALPGIGAPIASVILHFIFPTVFPIYDFRTTETLHYFCYLNSKTVSPGRYREFQEAIQKLRKELVHYDLRQIDRALFAFHKNSFSHKKNCTLQHAAKRPIIKCRKLGRSIPNIVKSICEELGANGKMIERSEIIQKAIQHGLNESSILPADYCDNTATGKWSKHSFLHSVGRGRYILSRFKSLS